MKDIHLDGEEVECVPVVDTCADIRRKISAHERKRGHDEEDHARGIQSQCSAIQDPS